MLVASSPSHAAIRSFKNLTAAERADLQESQDHVVFYDRALQELDIALKHKKISRREYGYEERDLVAFIGAEAKFQNDILTKGSGFDEDAREVMQNIAGYTTLVIAAILWLPLKGAPALLFSS